MPAAAQTVARPPAAAHPAAAPAAVPPKPEKPAGAIIPGSPLAALTSAAAPAASESSSPAPFGTDALGLSLTRVVGADATRTFSEFISAVQQSTRLTPVLHWLRTFSKVPDHWKYLADILMALVITILPGLVVEMALWFALARPRAGLIRRAAGRTALVVEADDDESENGNVDGLASAEAGETERSPRRRDSVLAWGRRLIFGLLHFGLAIVPLVGFVIVVQSLISAGLLTTRHARLAVIGIANAYLFCRIVVESFQFLFAPGAPSLRIVSMPEKRAAWLIRQARLLVATGFAGYAFVSVGEILGLPEDGGRVLLHLVVLAIHVELAVAVWQSRQLVGRWIAGKPHATGALAGFRRGFGRIWHIPALFYILALWIALAAGVHNALFVLLRIVLVVAAAALIGRLAWHGSSTLLERAFPDPSVVTARRPALFARARAYNPLIRGLIRTVIGLLVIILTLQGWGVDAFGWLFNNSLSRSLISAFISIVITIAIALTLWECANAYINGRIERLSSTGRSRQASRLRTLLPMLKASIGVSISLIAGLICLSKIGVNAAPLLAGAGVLGIAIGFGSQKLVQDIITGLFLLLEDAMQVGDYVSLASMSGTVERLSIRTIRLRGGDGSVNIIPFSAVTTVANMTRDFGYAQISIQVSYEEDLPRVYAVLADIARTMRAEPAWKAMMRDDLQIFGLDQFGASALVITGQIRTGPGQHWAVRREFYARVKARFEAEHIEMPYLYLHPAPPRVEPQVQEDAGGERKQGQGTLSPGPLRRAAPFDPQ
jgi:moderate conductance mechanosensitive channel